MKSRKVVWALVGLAVLAVIAGGIYFQRSQVPIADTVNVGAILPLTGSLALIQDVLKGGMEMAVDEINASGGINGRILRIVYQDNQGEPRKSVDAFQQLMLREKPPIVISDHSPLSAPLRPLADQHRVLLVSTIVSKPDFTKDFQYVIRDFVSSDLESKVLAEFMYSEKKVRRAAILYVADDYGQGAYEAFKKAFEGMGGKVVAAEQFLQAETSFRTILPRVYASRPDGLYLVGRERSFATALVQLRETKFSGTICTTISLNAKTVIDQAGNALEGVYFTNIDYFPDTPSTEKMRLFVSTFQKRGGDPRNYICVYGYDIIHYLAAAMREVGTDPARIKQNLRGKKLSLVRGEVVVPDTYDIQTPLVVAQVKDGRFVSVYSPRF